MENSNQSGFHLTAVLLGIVILAAIGFAGWRVWDKNQSESSSNNQTASPSATGRLEKIDAAKLKFDQAAATDDPIGDKNGPFYHDVYTATSTDGLKFSPSGNKVAEHASVPDAIKLPSGQLAVYAVDGAQRSKSGVLIAVSDDGGQSWQTGSMQLSREHFGGVADPQVVMADDGRLRLFYIVFAAPAAPGQPPKGINKVQSAVSNDGINFTEEQGVRFEYDSITDPDVIKIGSTWFMYSAQGPKQIYATSPDGLSFSYQGVARERGSVSKTVAAGGGKYRQFYCVNGISSSTTNDGINWSDEGVSLPAPAGKMICDPSPVQLNESNWLMIYKIAN